MGKVDFLFLFVPFIHREVDNPAKFETIVVDQLQLMANPVSRLAGELVELHWIAGREENGIADLERKLPLKSERPLRSYVLADRPGPALFSLTPENIPEARLTFALRPCIHAIAEGARASPGRGNGPHPRLRILLNHPSKN